jgi:mannose-6-phosphate isomerase-like protein (cupin superfamily)
MMPPSRNPFEPVPQGLAVDTLPLARVERVEQVAKPWGHEEIYALLEGSYVGKVLHVKAGGVLSLQQHVAKDETIAVQSGRVRLEHGPDAEHLQTVTLKPGDRLFIRAHTVHRVTADVDSVLLETSTAHPGWRTDVVRLEDRYGRGGTTAP